MKLTKTFDQICEAFYAGYYKIICRGGTRSGKTFAILQLIFLIAFKSKKSRIISVVSHSFPHLEMGAVRDFDAILRSNKINPDDVRTKKPYIYKIGNSTIEFISVDNMGKALGAARDILFVNECNKIKHNIIDQLATRTTEVEFYDFNPDGDFWMYQHEYHKDPKSIELVSTYLNNLENLTKKQIEKIMNGKERAEKERAIGKSGYWSWWWQVYGLGQMGRMMDRMVFPNYTTTLSIPDDAKQIPYGLDFGFSVDPTAMTGNYIRGNDFIMDEIIYETDLLNVKNENARESSIEERMIEKDIDRKKYIIAESAEPKSIAEIRGKGFRIYAVKKPKIIDRIRLQQQYNIVITERSLNIINEADNLLWPIDAADNIVPGNPIGPDHAFDASGYVTVMKDRLWR